MELIYLQEHILNQIPYIYTVRFDLVPEIEAEANQWTNTSHIQDLLNIGVCSAVRYKSIKGNQEYLHIYEIPNPETLHTKIYAETRNNDETGAKLRHGFINHSASVYEQVVTNRITPTPLKKNKTSQDSWGGIRSPFLITTRMKVDQSLSKDLILWNKTEHFPLILAATGALSARLCVKTEKQHPTSNSKDPDWLAIYEIDNLNFLNDQKVAAANSTEWASRIHNLTSQVDLNILERIHPT